MFKKIAVFTTCLVTLLSSFWTVAYANTTNIRLQGITNIEEISQQSIRSIYQDTKGFMWFGTQEGLNRYDGVTFKPYITIPNDVTSISDTYINAVTEDKLGNIWVATKNGVSKLDPNTNTFTRYMADGSANSINDKEARHIITDSSGTVWVATRKGINKYLADESRFKSYNLFADDGKYIDVYALAEDIAGNLWLGTNSHGIMLFDPQSEVFRTFDGTQYGEQAFPKTGIRALYIDDSQVLWIGSFSYGLFRIDLKQNLKPAGVPNIKHVSALPSKRVLSITRDSLGRLWVGTFKGAYYQDENELDFHALKQPGIQFSNLLNEQIWALHTDRSGLLWIGGFAGLSKWNTRTTQFDHFHENQSQNDPLVGNTVFGVQSIHPDKILVATTKALNVMTLSTGNIETLPYRTDEQPGMNQDRVMSLAVVDENEIWFGHRKTGAVRYDVQNNSYTQYEHDESDPNSLGANGITSILKAKDGTLWFGSYGGGLNRYLPETDSFKRYQYSNDDVSTIGSNIVMSLMEDTQGRIWVGTWDAGVSIFVPDTETAFRLQHDNNNADSLSGNRIISLFQDRDENIWIGTAARGLNVLSAVNIDKGMIAFEKLSTLNKLPSNVIYGIQQDDAGYVWISTNKGLIKLDENRQVANIYNYSDGIQDNEFNNGADHKDADGYLYFGGMNGLTRFKPDQIQPNLVAPNIEFTTFQRLNSFHPIQSQLNDNGVLEVSYHDYLIGFEFAALDFVSPKENKYKYILEGFDQDWVEVRGDSRAMYTNLPAGKYRFRVIASNSDSVWNRTGAAIDIIVHPAPWLSWWAYSLYAIALLSVLYLAFLSYQRRNNTRINYQIRLEKQVASRTEQLSQLNEQLLKISITDELTGLYNRRYLSDVIDGKLNEVMTEFGNKILSENMDAVSGPRMMAMMFDLDGFKPINDNYGHEAGDKVIIQVANILKETCKADDVIVRWGGDEYMIVAKVDSLNEAEHFAEKIRIAIARHGFDVGLSNKFYLSSSIGFALYPFSHYAPHSVSWDQVHSLADQALYKSKGRGKNTWTGIAQSNEDLPLSLLGSIVPNLEHAIASDYVKVLVPKK